MKYLIKWAISISNTVRVCFSMNVRVKPSTWITFNQTTNNKKLTTTETIFWYQLAIDVNI